MKIIEKKAPVVKFKEIKPGQIFKTNSLGYMMKIEEIQSYDADEREPFWVNAVSLRNGSFAGVLDAEFVEQIEECEIIIY